LAKGIRKLGCGFHLTILSYQEEIRGKVRDGKQGR